MKLSITPLVTAFLLSAALCTPAWAQTKPADHSGHHPATGAAAAASAPTSASSELAEAQVRNINKPQRKITLKHGEIKSLDMPPMTMVFNVRQAAMLERVQIGDTVRFSAEKIDGAYVVTAMETVPAK